MIKLNRIIIIILFILLFSPLIGYAYTVWFKLPKTITHFYVFFVTGLGFFYLFIKKPLIIPFFAKLLLIFAFYEMIWGLLIGSDLYFLTEIFYYLRDFAVFFIIVMIYNTRFNERFIANSILIMKITVVIAATVSVIQVFNTGFLNPDSYYNEDYGIVENVYNFRRISIFGFIYPNALGLAFIPLLSVLIGYLLYTKNKYYISYLLLGVLVALLSNTRYVMIGSVLITLQVLVFSKARIGGYFKYLIILGIASVIVISALQYLGYDLQEWFNQRLLAEGSIEETTRYKAIDTFINFFPQNPILGIGRMSEEIRVASEAKGSSQIHVGYLNILVIYGIAGSFFLFSTWYLLVKRLYRTAKQTNYWGSLFGFITFLWSFATMNLEFIFFYGLIFVMVFDKYFWDKQFERTLSKEDKSLIKKPQTYRLNIV